MASRNFRPSPKKTYEGATAVRVTNESELRRAVLSCLLWEKEFYESGESIATRIANMVPKVDPNLVANLAVEAREKHHLRHAPLWLVINMLKHKSHRPYVKDTIRKVVQRPDELSELLALYFNGKKKPIASQLKKGLAEAFTKFNAYQLAKWNRAKEITLRDVMFLCHPKPKNDEQIKTFKQLAEGNLPTPDTWETSLSSGGDKKEHWTRLLKENKLGALALIRNLRNMVQASVDEGLVRQAVENLQDNRVLPFRYIAAAKHAPIFEDVLETAMFNSIATHKRLYGKTGLLVDVSGSMFQPLSAKSDLSRMEAANGLAMLLREICEDVVICTFSTGIKRVAPRRGFALRDAVNNSLNHSATYLGAAVNAMYNNTNSRFRGNYRGHVTFEGQNLELDRLIVITDEQSHDVVPSPQGLGYMINVASYKQSIGYGDWVRISGFSEAVVTWIQTFEEEFYNNKKLFV